jgi:hypothetical protein
MAALAAAVRARSRSWPGKVDSVPAADEAHFHGAGDFGAAEAVAAGAHGAVELEERVEPLVLERLRLGA